MKLMLSAFMILAMLHTLPVCSMHKEVSKPATSYTIMFTLGATLKVGSQSKLAHAKLFNDGHPIRQKIDSHLIPPYTNTNGSLLAPKVIEYAIEDTLHSHSITRSIKGIVFTLGIAKSEKEGKFLKQYVQLIKNSYMLPPLEEIILGYFKKWQESETAQTQDFIECITREWTSDYSDSGERSEEDTELIAKYMPNVLLKSPTTRIGHMVRTGLLEGTTDFSAAIELNDLTILIEPAIDTSESSCVMQ